MNEMIFADYYSMIRNSGIDTKIIEYRLDNILVSCCITDFIEKALSMVYSFYSPHSKKYSMGKYMILDHIKFSKNLPSNNPISQTSPPPIEPPINECTFLTPKFFNN